MKAIDARKQIQAILGTAQDGFGPWGHNDQTALDRLGHASPDSEWPPAPGRIISSPGWAFAVRVSGEDLMVDNIRGTCFGGSDDPQDNGQTASGISTKKNPDIRAVSLPMDFGDAVPNTKGSPIPRLPWNTMVQVEAKGVRFTFPVIDIGPAKRVGNAIDFTIAAARQFNPSATARNFEIQCSYRIIGGAKYLPT